MKYKDLMICSQLKYLYVSLMLHIILFIVFIEVIYLFLIQIFYNQLRLKYLIYSIYQ